MKIKGIIFDMDGTIVNVPYDWAQIRSELDTQGKPILSYIQSLPEPQKSQKWAVLEGFEEKATLQAELKAGIRKLLEAMQRHRIKTALVSNNSQKNVSFLLEKFSLEFDRVISRESGLYKPSAEPFLKVLQEWGIAAEECCVVGDSVFDILAAQAADINRVYIIHMDKDRFKDYSVEVLATIPQLQEHLDTLLP
ncbi:MAG: HAD-IA family hydrolase [Candidatus Aminicenantes bacterium]|nr:HAD-IA family hydrolase [Candidatus Aminicenantes bacterium]